jgi:hypothetical protein
LLLCLFPTVRAQDLLPVPDMASQVKAEKLIKDLFKGEYAKRRTSDWLDLSEKLLQQAADTKDDPAARFVLLREARDLAARAGDLNQALRAVDEAAKVFAVRSGEMKATALETAIKARNLKATPADQLRTALAVLKEATDEDDYEAAARLLKLADTLAPSTKSVPLVTAVRTRAKEVAELKKEFEKVQPALAALRKDAEDADANLTVGKYLALVKGKWPKALPLLALGKDAKWKALAKQDLEEPVKAAEQVALGDSWWDLGEGLDARAQGHLHARAGHWYKQALPELAGLTRTKVEKRLQEVEGSAVVETPVEEPKGWLVVFRSANPALWDKKVNQGPNARAIPIKDVPDQVRYLKLTNVRSKDFVVIEMTKEDLAKQADDGKIGWQGTGHYEWRAHQLGIYDRGRPAAQRGDISVCILKRQGYRGWGFGVRGGIDDMQGYSWAGAPIAPTVFEIAVTTGPLSPAETKKLLQAPKEKSEEGGDDLVGTWAGNADGYREVWTIKKDRGEWTASCSYLDKNGKKAGGAQGKNPRFAGGTLTFTQKLDKLPPGVVWIDNVKITLKASGGKMTYSWSVLGATGSRTWEKVK